jgi:hypothetical protein
VGVRVLERPIISYAIIFFLSIVAALLFFLIGGSVAEISGQGDTFLGLSIKAGGAIAGFVIIFILSLRVIERLNKITPKDEESRLLREFILRINPRPTSSLTSSLECTYCLYDTDEGQWGNWKPVSFVRDPAGLIIFINEMGPKNILRVKLVDNQNHEWTSTDDHSFGVSAIEMKQD